MADRTSVEWTQGADGTPGASWNPITGCSVLSPGCTNCYAMRLAGTRMRHHWSRVGLTYYASKAGPVWNGQVRFNKEWIDQPLRWRRPRRIFVCAHGDLFHESVPDEWIDRIFAVMALCPQHTFQVLTKRAERMRDYLGRKDATGRIWEAAAASVENHDYYVWALAQQGGTWGGDQPWPCPNIHLGVSVEDQPRADERIPPLLQTPAAVRWVSAEPLLSALDLSGALALEKAARADLPEGFRWRADGTRAGLNHVIIGGESGPHARPFEIGWARSIIAQCKAAGVPVFMKQIGSRPQETFEDGSVLPHRTPDRKGSNPAEWPEDLRIRELPI